MRGPPLQARVVAAYGAVLQLANMLLVVANKLLALTDGDPGAHGHEQANRANEWTGAKQTERGKNSMKAVGLAGKG